MCMTAALIVGAGRGRRFGGDIPKQYCSIDGEVVLRRTLLKFLNHPDVDEVACVINPEDLDLYVSATEGLSLSPWVAGGRRRRDSVRLGLEGLANGGQSFDKVLVHDAVRPFVSPATISKVLKALEDHDGAIPALDVTDTVKRIGPDNRILETVPRTNLRRAQTPQGFRFETILDIHGRFLETEELTDDSALLEAAGKDCVVVEGQETNIKITTKADMKLATTAPENIILETRTGFGFDVHRLTPGDGIVLCGVPIPHNLKLKGHSDADVAMHALADAILGAIGEGDIGTHFPPSEPRWKGAASRIFVERARDLVSRRQGRIVHVDVTIICEEPKVQPHRNVMRKSLGECLNLSPDRVSIKATTSEGLGFTGRKEGIAAQAVASVSLPFKPIG